MDSKTIISAALRAALANPACDNHAEITQAITALDRGSPVAALRARRAVGRVLARIGRDESDQAAADTMRRLFDTVDDRGGILPDADGKIGHIHLRVEMDRKTAYVQAAQSGGESLSEWMTRHCDRESGYQP